MITLRCTRKLLTYYSFKPEQVDREPTSALGDWYANIIGSATGDLLIFVNETSRLGIVLPPWIPPDELPTEFRGRVLALLRRIDVPAQALEREAFQMGDIKIGKTRSRKILGSMNEVAYYVQTMTEHIAEGEQMTLDEMEDRLAKFIHMPLKAKYPREAAVELLAAGSDRN